MSASVKQSMSDIHLTLVQMGRDLRSVQAQLNQVAYEGGNYLDTGLMKRLTGAYNQVGSMANYCETITKSGHDDPDWTQEMEALFREFGEDIARVRTRLMDLRGMMRINEAEYRQECTLQLISDWFRTRGR